MSRIDLKSTWKVNLSKCLCSYLLIMAWIGRYIGHNYRRKCLITSYIETEIVKDVKINLFISLQLVTYKKENNTSHISI